MQAVDAFLLDILLLNWELVQHIKQYKAASVSVM